MDTNCKNCEHYETCRGAYVKIYNEINNHIDAEFSEVIYKNTERKYIIRDINVIYEDLKLDRNMIVSYCFHRVCSLLMLSRKRDYSYASLLKEKYPDEDFSSGGMGSNAIYKKRVRYFEKLSSMYNFPIENYKNCNRDSFEYWEFYFKCRFGRKIKSEELDKNLEQKKPFKKDLFKIMYGYALPKDNNYRIKAFREDLKRIDLLYEDIELNSKSYFERCLKYSLLEQTMHYETAYGFAYVLEEYAPMFQKTDKISILFWESAIRNMRIHTDEGLALIEFPMLALPRVYVYLFFDEMMYNIKYNRDPRPTEISKLFAYLSEAAQNITYRLKKEWECMDTLHVSECMFAENIFKNYIGMGQHIFRNKDMHDVFIENLMEIFSAYDDLDVRIDEFYEKNE